MVAQEALTKTSGSYNYNQLEAEILGTKFPTKSSQVSSTESSVKLQIDGEQVYIIWWQGYREFFFKKAFREFYSRIILYKINKFDRNIPFFFL